MNKIMLVGEALSEKDEETGRPFSGNTGYVLRGMLAQVGIDFAECHVTNVFDKYISSIASLCVPKKEGLRGYPALDKGKFLHPSHAHHLDKLYDRIARANPNIIIALGATAAWALLKTTGIKAVRGAIAPTDPYLNSRLGRTYKVLPTYNPANISREWTNRPICLSDFHKAKGEADSPDITRPSRLIHIRPTIQDLALYEQSDIIPADSLSIDIETKLDQITCIGFAPSISSAIVIPFHSSSEPDGNYWRMLSDELEAWSYVRRWCRMKPALFQNGLYDMGFLWRRYGITCPLASEDTMLLHHAHQLEMQKGLGFLATLYTNEASWKHMRKAAELKAHD